MHDDLLEQAREAAYLPPDAPPVWDLIEVMGRAWMGEAQGVEAIAADYLAHHRKAWAHVARIEGAHPWAALEARILACPELPLPVAERNEPDSIRSACALWRAALEGGDLREGVILDEEGRWRVWLCTWVGGWGDGNEWQRCAADDMARISGNVSRCNDNTLGWYDIYRPTDNDERLLVIEGPTRTLWGSGTFWCGPLGVMEILAFTPKTVAQAAQQCLIRIPDRIVTHFGLQRWQTSLGFEV